jgi:hypothetical protein
MLKTIFIRQNNLIRPTIVLGVSTLLIILFVLFTLQTAFLILSIHDVALPGWFMELLIKLKGLCGY